MMALVMPEDTLYCFDMIKLISGEILSICGNFDGPWYRARLAFYPNAATTRMIDGVSYRKASYETGYRIPSCQKVLNLRGEQHFIVHRTQIVRIYRASKAFEGLSHENAKRCQCFIDLLKNACRLSKDRHGLTGSGALHNILPTSDFDWVIYDRDPTSISTYVLSNTKKFKKELTFDMKHVYRKYAAFTGLNRKAILDLFKDRWKYFRFQNLRISLSFTDPQRRADDFLSPFELGKRVVLRGIITDSIGCYYMPYIIPICSNGKNHLVLTWLFLYNGAFKNGDVVEVSGREQVVRGKQYLLVEELRDHIRKSTAL